MLAPWRSQKSVRKHKDPITGNSFIGTKRYIQNPSMVTHDTIALLNDYHIFIINIRCTRN